MGIRIGKADCRQGQCLRTRRSCPGARPALLPSLRNQPFRVPESALLPVGTRPFGKPENGEPDRRFGKCPKNPRPFSRKPSTLFRKTLDPFHENPRPFSRKPSTVFPGNDVMQANLSPLSSSRTDHERPDRCRTADGGIPAGGRKTGGRVFRAI